MDHCDVNKVNKCGASGWIWAKEWQAADDEQARIVLFRRRIFLEKEAVQAELRISADTKYKLYINGKFVQFGPCRGDDKVWFYDEPEIVSYLRKGDNLIAVEVLRYPQEPEKGNHGMFRTRMPGLYVEGRILDGRGERTELSADAAWECRVCRNITFVREEERFAPLIIHEKVTGDAGLLNWKVEDTPVNGDFLPARLYEKEGIPEVLRKENLRARAIPFLYRKKGHFQKVLRLSAADFSGVKCPELWRGKTDEAHVLPGKTEWEDFLRRDGEIRIRSHREEIVEIDAGEEMTGFMKTVISGGKGAQIRFLYAECYVLDGTIGPEKIPVKGARLDMENGHLNGYEDVYYPAGTGTAENPEVYTPFWFRTFRIVRLSVTTGEEPLILHEMDYEETGYPHAVRSEVQTSDESLKPVWDMSVRTLQRCMHESYEDCPFYEQLQYIMDARQQILYTYSVSADDRLARKCMDDFRRAARPDGLLNASYPNCTVNVIPGFSMYYIRIIHDHMMYFGDRELVREHLPVIDGALQFFADHLTPEGYVGKTGHTNRPGKYWSYIDWATEWNDTNGMPTAGLSGPLTMESLLYLYGLQAAAELADFAGSAAGSADGAEYRRRAEDCRGRAEDCQSRAEDCRGRAEDYRRRAAALQKAIRKYCTGANGMLKDGPDVEEYSQHCQVFAVLTDTVDPETGKRNLKKTLEDKSYAQCTVAMNFYLFRALEKTGLYEYTDRRWDTWRRMLALGCTTCVEAEIYARSECHGWGALILYELPSVVLGVRPAAPGYGKIRVAPVPGYLTHAEGTAVTPQGEVKVAWKLEDGKMKISCEAPEGVEIIADDWGEKHWDSFARENNESHRSRPG